MQWYSWSRAPFRAAVESGRPLLLLLETQWSAGCRRMEREAFADPRVRAIVDGEYVAVRVDADLRPDVAERYALDGWPSTLLLTDEGEVLQGGTYLEASALADLLTRTSARYRSDRASIARRAVAARVMRGCPDNPAAIPTPGPPHPQDVLAVLLARADPAGGFRGAPKFLHESAVLFLLRCNTDAARSTARRTLDASASLQDEDGRCFRCAGSDDWSDVVKEVTAESQSSAIRLLTAARDQLGDTYLERLRRAVRFARERWLDNGSTDLTTDRGADLASACLSAAQSLDDTELGRAALALLERVSLATYRPGRGVRHYQADAAPDLLSDHVWTVTALLDAHEATGELPYSMLAEELGHRQIEAFMDEEAGALRDRVHEPDDFGRLAEPLHPFLINAQAARAFGRLAAAAGEPRFGEVAARLLAWTAGRWSRQGLDAAAGGLASLDLIDWRDS